MKDFKELTVVGVLTPKQPKDGKKIIQISPRKDYLENFKNKEIYFAETLLSVNEFTSFFEDSDVGGHRVGVYMKILNSDTIFKQNLFKDTDFNLKEIRYDENYKRILNLENMLTQQNELTQDRVNHLRVQILYAQTFEQAEYLLHEGSLNNPSNKVLYVNYVTGYAIHLLTGCEFLEDVSIDLNTKKLKDDLALIYKAYKLRSVWEFDQKPNFIGTWGKGNDFKLFYFFSNESSQKIEGYINDQVGFQYFEGVFLGQEVGFKIKTRYLTNHGMLPSRWHLINCFSEKEMFFCFQKQKVFFETKNGIKKACIFKK